MSALAGIITEKCPKCGKGKVFAKKGNPLLFQMPRMNERCPVCSHKFEKEPGYFFGSMFVSYAVTVGEMIIFFLLAHLFIESFVTIVVLIGLLSILLSTFNFRLSRMIWIYMFDGKGRQV
ncbi:DUF983 domain-containing protein [uncultured Flavobacterium sp.]|uniref:DUF983 domain-containing protein n=1 Tax=uncultured Flavobacterium sp. TaxID=165435 RepID=UPI0025E548DC|nr:DUF983 domain-containing protein [uncultured Flavobacterium sp.]